MTDNDFTKPSYLDDANQLRLTTETMRWFWNLYLPDETLRACPDAAPLRSSYTAGLPPAVIVTAEHDVLRDDGERYAGLLRESGVAVEVREFAGQMHGFMSMIGVLPASETAIDFVAQRITSSLEAEPAGGSDSEELVGTCANP